MSNTIIGKIQPQATEIEDALIGILLCAPNGYNSISNKLTTKSFYNPVNSEIYKAIQEVDKKGSPIDLITVLNQLKENERLDFVGGAAHLAGLTNMVTSNTGLVKYALIIAQKAMLRDAIEFCNKAINQSYKSDADPFQIIDEIQVNLMSINQSVEKGLKSMELLSNEMIDKLKQGNASLTGIHTSFNTLDQLLGGWQKSDLVILAARPGMGKTALMRRIAASCVLQSQKCCAIFSLEMSSLQLTQRFYSAESGVYYSKFQRNDINDMDWREIEHSATKLMKSKLYIDDTAAIRLSELRSKCIKLKQEQGLDLVMIDYITLMRSGNNKGNREQEVAEISRGLKALAKDLNITIISLAQLSRKVEDRNDKRPMLSDLRESGQIEQDADVILFLMRPEYYNFPTFNFPDIGEFPTAGKVIVDVAKNRNGSIGAFTANFIGSTMDFKD